jgi:hypothetical protein
MRLLPPRSVEAVRLLDAAQVLGPQNAGVAHQPDRAAGSERAATEAQEVELVARLVALDQEAIALPHVAGEAEAEGAAADALKPPGADPALVMQELGGPVPVLPGDGESELRHVRGSGGAVVQLIRPVPGPVATDDQPLGHEAIRL